MTRVAQSAPAARAGERASASPVDARAPQLRLENQICFLFHRISRDLTATYRPLLSELGLTYPQYLVMLVLWERDGASIGEIGQRVCLDSGTLSPLVRRLEKAGLVSAAESRPMSAGSRFTSRTMGATCSPGPGGFPRSWPNA